MAMVCRSLISYLLGLMLFCDSLDAATNTCECRLGFKTYYIQTFMISQIQSYSNDWQCEPFIDACTEYCNDKGTALITNGARTELSLAGRTQKLGDYLCKVGAHDTPLKPSGTDLSMYISVWSCGVPRRLTKQLDTNFCCRYNKYRQC